MRAYVGQDIVYIVDAPRDGACELTCRVSCGLGGLGVYDIRDGFGA